MCLLICLVKDKLIILTCVCGSVCALFIFGHRFSHALHYSAQAHKKPNLHEDSAGSMPWHIAVLIINWAGSLFLGSPLCCRASEFFQIFAQYLSELINNMSESNWKRGERGGYTVSSQHISTFLYQALVYSKALCINCRAQAGQKMCTI